VKEKNGKKKIVCNGDQTVATSAEKRHLKGKQGGRAIDDNRVQAAPGPGYLLRQNDV